MKKEILFITEHLLKLLNEDQLLCIKNVCHQCGFNFLPIAEGDDSFSSVETPSIILASEQCLYSALEKYHFTPKANFILLGMHKDGFDFSKFKDNINELRFILGDPPLPLLEAILKHTLDFFSKEKIASINQNFNQQNSFSVSFELQNSKDRTQMQQKIIAFFKEQIEKNKSNLTTGASTYARNLSHILEEFLMNAIWDANPKYAQQDRTKPIQLLDNEKVNIFCLFDGTNLILSVTDPFGSFTAKAIQKYIHFSLGIIKEVAINEKSAGAGIGLLVALQKIGVLVFEVEKGKATRATAITRGDQSLRDMQKRSRTLLFYEK